MKKTDYKNRYNADHYDRIVLMVPKGEKETLKQLAADQHKSLNEFLCGLILHSQDDIFDRMQIAEKYRVMISRISGSTKDGYTVHLRPGYIHAGTGQPEFFCQTKPELRKQVKKCLAQDT